VPPSSELGATEFAWSEAAVAMLSLFCFVDEVFRGGMQDVDVEHSSSDSSSSSSSSSSSALVYMSLSATQI
jgi:hypothetical protein